MFLTLKFKKPDERQRLIDVREVFNIWDVLKSKYDAIEHLDMWYQLVHDADLRVLIARYSSTLKQSKVQLEKMLEKYAINGPDQGRLASNWAANSEVLSDEVMATYMLLYVQEHMENLLRAVRTSVTNDEIRVVFIQSLKRTIEHYDPFVKYLKLKGWMEVCPLYVNAPSDLEEKITCAGVAHLWDHLTLRYDNIRQTKYLLSFVHDIDLKMILQRGLDKIVKQAGILEIECQRFGISLPKRPSEVIVSAEATNSYFIGDDHIYRLVLDGLQGASIMHADALKQCTYNDRIRDIFKKMLLEEVDFYNSFVKYGKTKGWMAPMPTYRP